MEEEAILAKKPNSLGLMLELGKGKRLTGLSVTSCFSHDQSWKGIAKIGFLNN